MEASPGKSSACCQASRSITFTHHYITSSPGHLLWPKICDRLRLYSKVVCLHIRVWNTYWFILPRWFSEEQNEYSHFPVDSMVVWDKKAELPKYVELTLDDSKTENLLTLSHLKTKQNKAKKHSSLVVANRVYDSLYLFFIYFKRASVIHLVHDRKLHNFIMCWHFFNYINS